MSSHLLILLTLMHFPYTPPASQSPTSQEVIRLLNDDAFERAETLLAQLPESAETLALQGEVEFRKGNFAEAQALFSRALARESGTARAHFGVGKLAMSKLRSKPALESFRRAIELDPKEPQYLLGAAEASALEKDLKAQSRHLEAYLRLDPQDEDRREEARATLEVLQKLEGRNPGRLSAPDMPAPVQFRKSLNLLFTEVSINGKGPFEFVIDTGASQTVLSEKLAERLGLRPISQTLIHGVGGSGKVPSRIYELGEVTVGDIKVSDLPVGAYSDPLLTQVADGILGTSMLSDFVLTIDYPESTLSFSRSAPKLDGALDVRIFSNLILVPGTINGLHRGSFILDTGAVTSVLSHGAAAKLGVDENTPGAKIDAALAGVGGFQASVLLVREVALGVASATEAFSQLVAINTREMSRMIGTEVSGVLGFDFLEDYKVIIDYNNVGLWIVPSR